MQANADLQAALVRTQDVMRRAAALIQAQQADPTAVPAADVEAVVTALNAADDALEAAMPPAAPSPVP